MSDNAKRVSRLLEVELGIKPDRFGPDSRLIDDLGADSIDMVEICMAMEEEFQTEISDAQFEDVTTVQDLIGLADTLTKR